MHSVLWFLELKRMETTRKHDNYKEKPCVRFLFFRVIAFSGISMPQNTKTLRRDVHSRDERDMSRVRSGLRMVSLVETFRFATAHMHANTSSRRKCCATYLPPVPETCALVRLFECQTVMCARTVLHRRRYARASVLDFLSFALPAHSRKPQVNARKYLQQYYMTCFVFILYMSWLFSFIIFKYVSTY